MQELPKGLKALVAMCCITVVGAVAIYKGYDTGLLTIIVAAIAGLGGFAVGKKA